MYSKNRIKIIFYIFLSLILISGTFLVANYFFNIKQIHHVMFDNAIEKSSERERFLNTMLNENKNLLLSIKENKIFTDYLKSLDNSVVEDYFLGVVLSNKEIMQVRYIDKYGMEKIRIDRETKDTAPIIVSKEKLQNKSNRYYFNESKTKEFDNVWFSALDLNIENDKIQIPFKPTYRAILPIDKESDFDGILIINYYAEYLIEKLVDITLYDMILIDDKENILIHHDSSKSWSAYLEPTFTLKELFPDEEPFIMSQEVYRDDNLVSKHMNLPFENKLIAIYKLQQNAVKNFYFDNFSNFRVQIFILFIISVIGTIIMYRLFNESKEVIKANKLFTDTFELAAVGIAHVGTDGSWIRVNQKLSDICGYEKHELLKLTFQYITHPDDLEKDLEYVNLMLEKKIKNYTMKKRYLTKNGLYVWVRLSVALVCLEDGTPDYFISVVEDITKEEISDIRLKMWAKVFTHMNEAILITDEKGIILDVNNAFSNLTGYSKEYILGRHPSILKSNIHNEEFYKSMWLALEEEGSWSGNVYDRHKNGITIPLHVNISSVKNKAGVLKNYIAIYSDISYFEAKEVELKKIAYYDALTSLPNRLLFIDRIKMAIVKARRENHLLAVVFIDLDGFKNINDTHGHDAGDELLVKMSEKMNKEIRAGDTLCRFGGDEFVAILTGLDNKEDSISIIERISEVTKEEITVTGISVRISSSIGVTYYSANNDVGYEKLLQQADQAMYNVKNDGKQGYAIYNS